MTKVTLSFPSEAALDKFLSQVKHINAVVDSSSLRVKGFLSITQITIACSLYGASLLA